MFTAKLKLQTNPEQFQALRQTQLAYRDALNAVSKYAFAQGKTSNVMRLHKGMYNEVRARFRLPSQLACSVERQVGATYKDRQDQATLQGTGHGSQVCRPNAHLQLPARL